MVGITTYAQRHTRRGGYTILELIIALAIAGVIGAVMAMGIVQTGEVTSRSDNHTDVSTQLQDAGYWIQKDTRMAQAIAAGSQSGTLLTLEWMDWSDCVHHVDYQLDGAELRRTYSTSSGTTSTRVLVDCVVSEPELTFALYNPATPMATVQLTASKGSGARGSTQTRVFQVRPRTQRMSGEES